MKTTNILTVFGAIALFAITTSVIASDSLLSPRAKDNQIKVVAGVANDADLITINRDSALSPRAAENQSKHIAGMETVTVKCPVIGSPRYLATVGNAAHMKCCNLTLAECSTMNMMKN